MKQPIVVEHCWVGKRTGGKTVLVGIVALAHVGEKLIDEVGNNGEDVSNYLESNQLATAAVLFGTAAFPAQQPGIYGYHERVD